MKAPDHIKGRMSRLTHQMIRDDRNKWAADMAEEGHSFHAIAKALNISTRAAYNAARKGGLAKKSAPPSTKWIMAGLGVRFGGVGLAFKEMHPKHQNKLIDEAARYNVTIAEALVSAYKRANP